MQTLLFLLKNSINYCVHSDDLHRHQGADKIDTLNL
jgi:hypothetical protein